jgi:hypothetical protein
MNVCDPALFRMACDLGPLLQPNLGYWVKLRSTTGEIMIKTTKNAKVKILFQGLHMTRVIFVLVYNLKFCISNTPFNTTF